MCPRPDYRNLALTDLPVDDRHANALGLQVGHGRRKRRGRGYRQQPLIRNRIRLAAEDAVEVPVSLRILAQDQLQAIGGQPPERVAAAEDPERAVRESGVLELYEQLAVRPRDLDALQIDARE
jgi:hypothetical protein